MANQCKEHNVEKYIQWVTTLSLTILVYLYSFTKFELIAVLGHPRSSILVPIEAHMQLPVSH